MGRHREHRERDREGERLVIVAPESSAIVPEQSGRRAHQKVTRTSLAHTLAQELRVFFYFFGEFCFVLFLLFCLHASRVMLHEWG